MNINFGTCSGTNQSVLDEPSPNRKLISEIMRLNLKCYNQVNNGTESSRASDSFGSVSSPKSNEFSSPEMFQGTSNPFGSQSEARSTTNDEDGDYDDEYDEINKHVTKLFVGNLPTSTTLPELLAVFRKYGPVNDKLSVVKDQNYAFIHFFNRKDAKVALKEVNDSLFKDRYIRVQFSTSQGFNSKLKGFNKYFIKDYIFTLILH